MSAVKGCVPISPKLLVAGSNLLKQEVAVESSQLKVLVLKKELSLLFLTANPEALLTSLRSKAAQSLDRKVLEMVILQIKLKPRNTRRGLPHFTTTKDDFDQLELNLHFLNFVFIHFLDMHFDLELIDEADQTDYTSYVVEPLQALRRRLNLKTGANYSQYPVPQPLKELERFRQLLPILMSPQLKKICLEGDYHEILLSVGIVAAWQTLLETGKLIILCPHQIAMFEAETVVRKLESFLRTEGHQDSFELHLVEDSVPNLPAKPLTSSKKYIWIMSEAAAKKPAIVSKIVENSSHAIILTKSNKSILGFHKLAKHAEKIILLHEVIPELKCRSTGEANWHGKTRLNDLFPKTKMLPREIQYLVSKVSTFDLDSYGQATITTQSDILSKSWPKNAGNKLVSEFLSILNQLITSRKLSRIIIWACNPSDKAMLVQLLSQFVLDYFHHGFEIFNLLGESGTGVTQMSEVGRLARQQLTAAPEMKMLVVSPVNFVPYWLHIVNPQVCIYWNSKEQEEHLLPTALRIYLKGAFKRLNMVHLVVNNPNLWKIFRTVRNDDASSHSPIEVSQIHPKEVELKTTLSFKKAYTGPMKIWDLDEGARVKLFPGAQEEKANAAKQGELRGGKAVQSQQPANQLLLPSVSNHSDSDNSSSTLVHRAKPGLRVALKSAVQLDPVAPGKKPRTWVRSLSAQRPGSVKGRTGTSGFGEFGLVGHSQQNSQIWATGVLPAQCISPVREALPSPESFTEPRREFHVLRTIQIAPLRKELTMTVFQGFEAYNRHGAHPESLESGRTVTKLIRRSANASQSNSFLGKRFDEYFKM